MANLKKGFKAFAKGFKERNKEENTFICPNPNCDYKGEAKKTSKGSTIVLFFLLFAGIFVSFSFGGIFSIIGLLPFIIYLLLYNGDKYSCPNCNMVVKI